LRLFRARADREAMISFPRGAHPAEHFAS